MQAALMLRSKQRVARRKKMRNGRPELPSNVATKDIAPFPRYPPESWCAQGKAAWLERGRRCSVPDQNAASCHRRWVKRNRIHDSSLGGSSDEDDFLGVLRGPSSFANAFLYVGLGTVAIGLVISFVGTGEKGFKTVELRLIGPSLIGIGLICCILRILFCICPSTCITGRKKKKNKVDADYTTSLLQSDQSVANNGRGGGGNSIKRVQIARGPNSMQKFPTTHSSHRLMKTNSKTMEGMEALRQLATTSLLIQEGGGPSGDLDGKQKQSSLSEAATTTGKRQAFGSSNSLKRKGNNRVVPIIKEPDNILDDQEDVRRFDAVSLDIFNLSDGDDEDEEDDLETSNSIKSPDEDSKASVIHRLPLPCSGSTSNQTIVAAPSQSTTITATLSTVNEKNHTEIEPGGGQGRSKTTVTTTTTVAEVESNRTTTSGSGIKSLETSNKLSKERAPINLGAIAKRPSAGRLLVPSVNLTTQATPTTLLDAVLIETSLCEPISPSFTINLPVSPPPTNFSISDHKDEAAVATPQRKAWPGGGTTSFSSNSSRIATPPPSTSSSAFAFPFPPNFAIPGPSYSSDARMLQQTTDNSPSSKFSFPSTSSAKSNGSNNAKKAPPASTGELLELVLSPSKLGQ